MTMPPPFPRSIFLKPFSEMQDKLIRALPPQPMVAPHLAQGLESSLRSLALWEERGGWWVQAAGLVIGSTEVAGGERSLCWQPASWLTSSPPSPITAPHPLSCIQACPYYDPYCTWLSAMQVPWSFGGLRGLLFHQEKSWLDPTPDSFTDAKSHHFDICNSSCEASSSYRRTTCCDSWKKLLSSALASWGRGQKPLQANWWSGYSQLFVLWLPCLRSLFWAKKRELDQLRLAQTCSL